MSMDVLFPLKAKGQLRTNVGLYRPMLSNDPAIFLFLMWLSLFILASIFHLWTDALNCSTSCDLFGISA